jgi:hypothetical protein
MGERQVGESQDRITLEQVKLKDSRFYRMTSVKGL